MDASSSVPCPCTEANSGGTCWNVIGQYMDQALKLVGGIGLFFSFTEVRFDRYPTKVGLIVTFLCKICKDKKRNNDVRGCTKRVGTHSWKWKGWYNFNQYWRILRGTTIPSTNQNKISWCTQFLCEIWRSRIIHPAPPPECLPYLPPLTPAK